MKSARQVAFETLYKIFYKDAYSNIAVDVALRTQDGAKPFTTALVYGTVERRLTLDYIIEKFCERPKPKVLTILRMGVYQLYFMDKVPESAAINESVNLAKENGLGFYSKLVNAVLHKVNDNRIDIEALENESVKYSVPEPLINMWKKAYGNSTVEKFLPTLNVKAPTFLIPNTVFVDSEELQYELMCEGVESEIVDEVVAVSEGLNVASSKAHKNGLYHVENISCYEAVKALDVQQGHTVLDMCSAPGGKAFTVAGLTQNRCKIIALDNNENRLKLVEDGVKRMGFTCIECRVNDATVFNGILPMADRVICDVPCSGFGIIRQKPEIRYKNLDSIKTLPEIQLKILENSAKYLKKTGKLLYSTCTLNRRENEKVAEKFARENEGFKILEMKTIFPSNTGHDGFFWAVIERA